MAFLSRCFMCFGSTADNQIAKSSITIQKQKPSLKIAGLAQSNKYPEEMETPATGAATKKHEEQAAKELDTSMPRSKTDLSSALLRSTTGRGGNCTPGLDLSRLSFLKQDTSLSLTDEQRFRHNKMKQLEMKVIESNILTVGSKYVIDGLCNINHTQQSLKKNKVCLGSELDANQKQANDIPVEKKTPEVFLEITYEMNLGTFFIVDLAKGSGTFIKIIKNHKISHGAAISIGSSTIMLRKSQEEDHTLELEFLEGMLKGRKQVFKPTEKKRKFTLGAAADCDISFKEYGLSRLQTTFEFKDGEWYAHDKDGIAESSNGTWQLLDKPLLITKDLVLKLGSTLFDIKLKDSELSALNGRESRAYHDTESPKLKGH